MAAKGTADFATSILALFMLVLALPAQADGPPGSGERNAPGTEDSPYLVLISIDGFSWDYLSIYPTPALDRIAAAGVRAESMRPVFPSLTFPNHYSIATGLYPAEHGIVHNHFPDDARENWYHLWDRDSVEDSSWYGGEPIWVTAEKHGLVSAAYYFVGTEAAIQGVPPSHWHSFDASVPGSDRVAQVVDWLQWPGDRRPRLITLYFEHVDTAGHDFGPGSPEVADAVAEVDANIGRLLDAIDGLDGADTLIVHGSTEAEIVTMNPREFSLVGSDVTITAEGVETREQLEVLRSFEGQPIDIPEYPADMDERYSTMDRWLNTFHGIDQAPNLWFAGLRVTNHFDDMGQSGFPADAGRLHRLALSSINQAVDSLKLSKQIRNRIERAVIVCNPAMHHLLAGYPVDTLAVMPFQPYQSQAVVHATGRAGLSPLEETCVSPRSPLRRIHRLSHSVPSHRAVTVAARTRINSSLSPGADRSIS